MFCPLCKVEYRDGFQRCADCDVDLVSQLPTDSELESAEPKHTLRIVHITHDQEHCVWFCNRLTAERISFKVHETKHQYLRDVERTFAVGVPPDSFHRAKEILKESCLDVEADAEE